MVACRFLPAFQFVFFLWLLIFQLLLPLLYIAFVYCGWHFRMELYRRFAETPSGGHDIDCMPPEIRMEYARQDFHPRFRDIKAMRAGTVVLTPLLYAIGGMAFIANGQVKRKIRNAEKQN